MLPQYITKQEIIDALAGIPDGALFNPYDIFNEADGKLAVNCLILPAEPQATKRTPAFDARVSALAEALLVSLRRLCGWGAVREYFEISEDGFFVEFFCRDGARRIAQAHIRTFRLLDRTRILNTLISNTPYDCPRIAEEYHILAEKFNRIMYGQEDTE